MSTICEAHALFNRFHRLLKRWSDKERLTPYDQKLLRAAIKQWRSIECPEDGKNCLPGRCPYADPVDWVTWRGYSDIGDLINRLDPGRLRGRFPERESFDMFDAQWARRPGHYNP